MSLLPFKKPKAPRRDPFGIHNELEYVLAWFESYGNDVTLKKTDTPRVVHFFKLFYDSMCDNNPNIWYWREKLVKHTGLDDDQVERLIQIHHEFLLKKGQAEWKARNPVQ